MKTFASRDFHADDYKVAEQVREELAKGNPVKWINQYETFYGVGWYTWVKKQLEGIDCLIEVDLWNNHADIPSSLIISPRIA